MLPENGTAGKADAGGVEFLMMRLQEGATASPIGCTRVPHTFSSAGIQPRILLDVLGFERSRCAFMVGGECYARAVPEGFDVQAFAEAFLACMRRSAALSVTSTPAARVPEPDAGLGLLHGQRRSSPYLRPHGGRR